MPQVAAGVASCSPIRNSRGNNRFVAYTELVCGPLAPITYHRELLPEDVVSEAGDEVEEEVPAGDVAVDVQRHPAAHLLPLRHHLVALQPVVPPLQLRAVDGVGDGEREAGRHVAVRQRVRPRQRRRRRVLRRLLVAQEHHLQLRSLEDRRPEQPRRLESKQIPCRLVSSRRPFSPQKETTAQGCDKAMGQEYLRVPSRRIASAAGTAAGAGTRPAVCPRRGAAA